MSQDHSNSDYAGLQPDLFLPHRQQLIRGGSSLPRLADLSTKAPEDTGGVHSMSCLYNLPAL